MNVNTCNISSDFFLFFLFDRQMIDDLQEMMVERLLMYQRYSKSLTGSTYTATVFPR